MNRRARIALILVFAIHLCGLFVWQFLSDMPHGLDEMDVSQDAVRWDVQWYYLDHFGQKLNHIVSPGMKTPPVFFWLYSFIANLVGPGWAALKIVPAIGFVLMLIGAFLLAREIAGRWAGVLAAFILGCYPIVFGFGHTANTSTLAAGFAVIALALLVRSQDMVKPHLAIAGAVAIGLAIMSERGTPVLIMAPTVMYLYFRAIYRAALDKENLKRRLPGILAFSITPIIIAGRYVYGYVTHNWAYTLGNIDKDVLKNVAYWPWPEKIWAFYIVELGRRQAGGLLALAVLAGMILLFAYRRREATTLFIALAGPMTIFSFFATKEVAYDFGILPVAAVVTATGIHSIESQRVRKWLAVVIALIALCTGIVGATGLGHPDNHLLARYKLWRFAFGTPQEIIYGPPTQDVNLKEIADLLIEKAPRKTFVAVAFANDEQRPLAWALMIEVAAHRDDLVSIAVPQLPGSDQAIVAVIPAAEPTEVMRGVVMSVCSFADLGVCDPTTDPERSDQILRILKYGTITPFAQSNWDGHDVILGTYQ